MSDNQPDPARATLPGYPDAQALALEFTQALRALGWTCHLAYDGHFFLEPAPKGKP